MSDNPEPTLADLMRGIWWAKFYMVAAMLILSLIAVLYMMRATPHYKASMIVAPADGYALGDYASMVENDRMAAMPFWRPKDGEGISTDFYRFIHTIRGPSVAEILLKDNGVLRGISKGGNDNATRTKEALAVYLDKRIEIKPLGVTPLRRISYAHPDPAFASAMLRKIHLVSDQIIRRDRKSQSQSRIDYLKTSLNNNANPDHRRGITNLLMQQEHIQMLVNLDEPYAAIVVEPAFTKPAPHWPNPMMIWIFTILGGAVIGYVIHAARQSVQS